MAIVHSLHVGEHSHVGHDYDDHDHHDDHDNGDLMIMTTAT